MKNSRYIFLILISIAIGLFFRIYQYGSIPNGLYQDETAIGYNALSILETGKDEHGVSYPLYFQSFGDNKLPVYIYMTALFMNFVHDEIVSVRIVSLLSGITALLLIYILVKQLFTKPIAVMSLFLLAINPWHIFFSRAALEINVAVTLVLAGTVLFIMSQKRKSFLLLIGSLLFFIVSLYTHSVTRIVAPVLFLYLVFCYRKTITSYSFVQKSSIGLLFILGIIPFIFATFLSNMMIGNQTGEFIFGGYQLANAIEFRSYAISYSSVISSMFLNRWMIAGWLYLQNIINFSNVDFYFISGDSQGHFGVGNFGMFHMFEIVFITIGLYLLIKKRNISSQIVLGWLILSIIIVSLTKQTPHATRSYITIIPLVLLSAVGLDASLSWILKQKPFVKYSTIFIFSAVVFYSLFYFYTSYFYRFPVIFANRWNNQDSSVVDYISSEGSHYDKVLFDTDANFAYSSLLYYLPYNPKQFHEERVYEKSGDLLQLVKTGKYEFKKIDWQHDIGENVLIISHPDFAPEGLIPIKEFYYPERPVVVYYDGKIGQYPTTDTAYAIYTVSNK